MESLFYKKVTQAAVTLTMLLLVFAPFASLTAQADTPIYGDTTDSRNAPAAGITFSNTNTNNATTIPASNASQYAPISTQQQQTSSDILANCKNFSVSGCVASMLYVFTVGIGSAFAYIAAYFFDITIQLSLNGASYGLDFVSTSWTTARDLGNMAFLFILLYIAFTIILRADTGNTMSLLAGVIIVALLVNFSFFFTRVIIDAGNILTIQFYNAIPAPPISQTIQGTPVAGTVASAVNGAASYAFNGDPTKTKDLTASIMNMIQVQNLLNNQSFNASNGSGTFNLISTIFIFIAAAIVLWLLTVAFITNGVKFLVRVVVLWFLIIVSPFAFVAAAVQGINKGYFKQWRELLFTHAFYPVAFMFIFLILNNFAITVSGGNTNLVSGVFSTLVNTGSNSWSAIGASLVSVAIRVGLVIAVLFIGMRASDGIITVGSEAAGKMGGWFGDKLKSGMLMPARFAGVGVRETLGRQAANDINTIKKNPAPTFAGRLFNKTYTKAVLAPIAGAKFGTANSYNDVAKVRTTEKKSITEAQRDIENKATVSNLGTTITNNINSGKKATDGISDQDKKKIQNLNKRELESMNAEQIGKVSALLTEDQVKRVNEMEKLTDAEKEKIKGDWEEHGIEAPFQKSIRKLMSLGDKNKDAKAEIEKLKATPGSMVNLQWAQISLKPLVDREHQIASTENRNAGRELSVAITAKKKAEGAHEKDRNQTNADALENANKKLDEAKGKYAETHVAQQATQAVVDDYKDLENGIKNVEPNANINGNGKKGTFKANLIK